MSRYFINADARLDSSPRGLFEDEEYRQVEDFFRSQPNLSTTPLRHLRGLGRELRVGDILLKDESARFGLNSFKSLGVTYALASLLKEGRITGGAVLACATEGNHGQAVAQAARQHGLEAKIYVPADMTAARREAITLEGAQVVIVDGDYDAAVRAVADDAGRCGWTIISDTSWPGYEEIPRRIMAGYTRLMEEAEEQWKPAPKPDVVLVQAGVGGLACAVVSWLCHRYGGERPFTIVCEPAAADSILASARAGKPVSLEGPFETIMAGLRCGKVSPLAWPTIAATVDAFVSIDDEECAPVMRALAHPPSGDPVVFAGASGACGLASLLAILRDESLRPLREASRLSPQSSILVINTEGATDPELFSQITGVGLS